jgi:hypothetical protein
MFTCYIRSMTDFAVFNTILILCDFVTNTVRAIFGYFCLFLCRLYGVVATYRDHFSVVCLSVCLSLQNLSGLLLINYWCNFIQTLQEWSVPSLVVHIVSIFRFNDFCQSYGPLIIFIFKVCPYYFSYTTNAISMKLYRIDL